MPMLPFSDPFLCATCSVLVKVCLGGRTSVNCMLSGLFIGVGHFFFFACVGSWRNPWRLLSLPLVLGLKSLYVGRVGRWRKWSWGKGKLQPHVFTFTPPLATWVTYRRGWQMFWPRIQRSWRMSTISHTQQGCHRSRGMWVSCSGAPCPTQIRRTHCCCFASFQISHVFLWDSSSPRTRQGREFWET